MITPRCPACASVRLSIDTAQPAVRCDNCNRQWPYETVADFTRFFVSANPDAIANADEDAMSWAIHRTFDLVFDLFTAANAGDIAEAVYGPDMSPGVKEIFAGQVQEVLAALRAQAVSKVRQESGNIIASVLKRSDGIM